MIEFFADLGAGLADAIFMVLRVTLWCAAMLAALGMVLWALLELIREWRRERKLTSWRDIESSSKGDQGLLGAKGCALGATRRRSSSEHTVVRAPWSRTLLLGGEMETEAALLAALAGWDGAIIYVDGQGGAAKVAGRKLIRFAPGRIDGASYNPMLAIRKGVHDWSDAKILASALLRSQDSIAITLLAALILDQLYAAPVEERTLAALRVRLFGASAAMEGMENHVHLPAPEAAFWRRHHEIANAGDVLARNPDALKAAIKAVRGALNVFGDGRVIVSTSGHQFDLSALTTADDPPDLVLEIPESDQASTAPIIAATVAQLVIACTEARRTDHRGAAKKRPVLLVVDDAAALGFVPLLQRRMGAAPECGLRFFIVARKIDDLAPLFGTAKETHPSRLCLEFDSIAAIGPQRPATAQILSDAAGAFTWFNWVRSDPKRWSDWFLPRFALVKLPVLPAEAFERTAEGVVYLFLHGFKPMRLAGLTGAEGASIEAAPHSLPFVAHDWSEPPPPQPAPRPKPPARSYEDQMPQARSKSEQAAPMQGELILGGGERVAGIPKANALRKMLNPPPKRKRQMELEQ